MKTKRSKLKKIPGMLFVVGLVLLTGVFLYLVFSPKPNIEAQAGWFSDSWKYRRRIPISYSGTETLTEYQLLLENIDTASLVTAGKVQSDCDDVRFTSENGELLEYYIVPVTCNTSNTQFWVKTQKIDAGAANIYMYYGNNYAQSYQDIGATFSYSTAKTVGYVMDPTVDDLNVISLHENNSITHNGTTVTLGPGQTDTTTFSPTGTTVSQWGAISAKGLFNADDNSDNTDLFVPVSWAGTEFEFWVRAPNGNAAVTFYFLAPWATSGNPATVTVYQAAVAQTPITVYGATGGSGSYAATGNQNDDSREFRISSTLPVLVLVRSYGAGNHANIMPLHSNSTQKWIGSGGSTIITNGASSLNYGYYRNGSASETTGTVAANEETGALTGGGNYGAGAFLVRSTNSVYTFNVQQHDDGDGPYEAHTYNVVTEQGTKFGSANQADYISVASTQAAVCKLYDLNSSGVPSLKATGTLTSSNTQIYFYGFNTGSTTAYTTAYGWFMECDKPVVAHYQKATLSESNLMSHVMMRQFTYPTPVFGTTASEETATMPAGYWKMDEGSDNTCVGGTKDVCDFTSTQNDGDKTEGTWLTQSSCVSGGCISFDGSNDVITIAADPVINQSGQSGYSVCGWIYPTGAGEGSAGEWWSKGNSYVRVDTLSGGTVEVSALLDLGTSDATLNTTVTIPINSWSHVCTGYTDDSDDELTIYINGTGAGSSTNGNGSLASDTSSAMYIGGDSSNNFAGYIDDVKIYTYERSSSQISTEYNAGLGKSGTPKGTAVGFGSPDTDGTYIDTYLKARWDFDEGAGDTLYDGISNTANGDLGGSGTSCPSAGTVCPLWDNSGKYSRTLDFDGTDDYVQVSANSNIDMNAKSGYSVCGWISPDNAGEGSAGELWSKGNSYIRVDTLSGSTVEVSASFDLASSDATYSSASTIPTGQWSFICVGYTDDSDDEITVYINGALSGSSTNGSGSPADDSASALYIGGVSSNNFDGKIDVVTVYNVELSANEVKIAQNYGQGVYLGNLSTLSDGVTSSNQEDRRFCVPGSTASCNSPVAEYKLDENSGTSNVYDSSENEFTGTMNGTMTSGDWVLGKNGSALDFDGGNDYISVGTGPTAINTISFWAYPYSTTNSFLELNGSAYISSSSGTLSATGFTSPTIYVNGKSSSTITANSWQFITVTTGTAINASAFNFGKRSTSYYSGILDEVKLYDYAKSQAQVSWEYDNGKPFAYYKLDECEGLTAYNSSSAGYNGIISIGTSGTQNAAGTCAGGTSSNAWYNGSTGKYNSSLKLDGTDDYINIGNTGTSVQSVSFWIKPATDSEYYLDLDGGTHHISSSGGTVTATGFGTPTIYIDGVVRNTLPDTTNWHHILVTTGTSFTASNVNIGRQGTNYMEGQIDEVKLFNYELTRTQALIDFNQGSSVRID